MSGQSFELRDTVVRAGAGAGKTTALVRHLLATAVEFRTSHGRWPRVVTTTFTRKATQELRERLLKSARQSDDAELLKYVLSKSDLQITTIHGILYLLLIQHGYRIGLDPSFELIEQDSLIKTAKAVLRSFAGRDSELSDLIRYFSVQKLAELFVHLSQESNLMPSVSALDESTLVAEEERFFQFVYQDVADWATTIKRIGEGEKWSQYADAISLAAQSFAKTRDLELLGNELFATRKPMFKESAPTIDPATHEAFEKQRKIWKKWVASGMPAEARASYLAVHQKLQKVYERFQPEFQNQIQQQGLVTLSDLEGFSIRLLREAPDAFQSFSDSWDYWLIDEYQDTSPTQVELLRNLVGNRASYTVGDPQQSIYLFRGAQVRVFDERQRQVESQNGNVELLTKSWRSDPEYVAFMNHLLPRFGRGFQKMIPKEDRELVQRPVAKWAKTIDFAQEMSALSQEIQNLLASGVRPKEIGILARRNKTLVEVARALEEQGFPVQVVSSGGFYDRREILDLMALLRVLTNPHDNASLVESLRSPWLCTRDQEIIEWSALREAGESLWSSLQRQKNVSASVEAIRRTLERATVVGLLAAFEEFVVQSGLLDFASDHDASGLRESNIWKFIVGLRQTFSRTGALQTEILQSLRQMIDVDSAAQESQAVAAFEPDKIVLMTVHASKGLEFQHVFLPGAGTSTSYGREPEILIKDGRWALSFRDFESEEMLRSPRWFFESEQRRSEEAMEFERLFYVALTRAKKTLFVSDGGPVEEGSWSDLLGPAWPEESALAVKVSEFSEKMATWVAKDTRNQSRREPYQHKAKTVRLQRQSVTTLLSGRVAPGSADHPRADRDTKSDSGFSENRLHSSLRGTKIHKCLEALHYGGPSAFTSAARELMQSKSSEAQKALDFILSTREPNIGALIQSGRVEWGFHLREGSVLIEGQVDLWGYQDGKLWIVDYKTGRPDQSDKAFQQLAIYGLALMKKEAIKDIQLCVVYPFEAKVLKQSFNEAEAWKYLKESAREEP